MAEPDKAVIGPQVGPQTAFLSTSADIAIYGGSAGGGKTWGLLMEPLRHIHNPGFGAVFFRRTTVQVRNEGGLWDESEKLYPLLGAAPKEHVLSWDFPAGATISFAHLEHDKTVQNWQGSQIPLICFDELTHFSAKQFWYMVSRNRSMCGVRPYIRATCNPDAGSWVATFIAWWLDPDTGLPIPERSGVLRWFVRVNDVLIWADSPEELTGYMALDENGEMAPIPAKSVTFIPAKLTDNKLLMAADPGYMANLMSLPTVERERLLGGNWKIKNTEGLVFTNWRVMEFETPPDAVRRFGADWGMSIDPSVLVSAFIGRLENGRAVSDPNGRCLFVDHEAHKVGCEDDELPSLFAGDCPRDLVDEHGRPRWSNPAKGSDGQPRWGRHAGVPGALKWRITADGAWPGTIKYMRRMGFKILPAIKGTGSVEEGIRFLQGFEIIVHKRCINAAAELSTYSFKIDPKTSEVLPLFDDKNNHVIDALRYAHEGVRRAKAPAAAVPKTNPPDLWGRKREDGDSWKTA